REPAARARPRADPRDPRGRPDPVPADPDDDRRHDHGGTPDRDRDRRRLGVAAPARLRDRRRGGLLGGDDAAGGPGRVGVAGGAPRAAARPGRIDRARAVAGGQVIALLLLAATVGHGAAPDTIPVMTLSEALAAGVAVTPAYVTSVGALENAEWGRRAARLTFLLPTITTSASYQELSTSQFNIGIGSAASAFGVAAIDARYDLFTGGRKLYTARQASAEFDRAAAGELGARFLAALEVERDYYAVLGARELLEVARQRQVRADEQFALARARVVSGATVQSDSLQLLLERQRAETDVINREADLTVARLQLGRRVGIGGPVDAAALPDLPPPALGIDLEEAIHLAVSQGPAWRAARAGERAADAALKAQRGAYLPTVALTANYSAFDDKFFPSATTRRAVGFAVS